MRAGPRVGRLAMVVVTVGVLASGAVVVIGHSDALTTHVVVAEQPAAALPPGSLAPILHPRWSQASVPSGATALAGATVVTAGSTEVTGRDPRTGASRWSYRRGNARLCAWAARDGAVIAAFGKRNGCTDMVALDAATGTRRWYRNLGLGGSVALSTAPGVVVARSGDQLAAVDTVSGLNRWTSRKPGCRFGPVAVGNAGAAAVLQCGASQRVLNHDAYADSERWTIPAPGAEPVVVGADGPVAVLTRLSGRPTLLLYDEHGKRTGSVADQRLAVPAEPRALPGAVLGEPTLLVWTGAAVVAIDARRHAVRWAARALGPPLLDADVALLAEPGGFAQRALPDGQVKRLCVLTGATMPSGAVLARAGPLIVASTANRVTAYG